jgi:hypothetical protein
VPEVAVAVSTRFGADIEQPVSVDFDEGIDAAGDALPEHLVALGDLPLTVKRFRAMLPIVFQGPGR